MLDTNMVSHMIRFPEGIVAGRASAIDREALCISAVVSSELRYGAHKRGSRHLSELVEEILERISIASYDDDATRPYAHIRDDLTRRGMLIGPVDLFIAAHAKSLDLILVTANIRQFSRIEGLKVENWLEESP